ncbi:hypothetical protein ABT168_04240 [Streptomyces sp. NPDC001793]|uniref:hypothetical protein n=1 Tax=Streptomyces sp. NPDC001793 TaxID=3154657 RepID=UPI0033307542
MDPELTKWVPDLLRKRKRTLSNMTGNGSDSAPDAPDDATDLGEDRVHHREQPQHDRQPDHDVRGPQAGGGGSRIRGR